MNVDQRQPAVCRHPVELAFPHVDPRLLEHKKKSGVLWQGVWQLDVTGAVFSRDPEREDRVHAVWLWLKGISIKGGCVVEDLEILKPWKIMQHESGAKANGTPRRQILVNFVTVSLEGRPRTVKPTVVMQIVYADFESVLDEKGAEQFRGYILAFRYEVE